jgi:hypothetical protein
MSETGITKNIRIDLGAGSQYWRGWACYFAALLAIAILLTSSSMEVWTYNLVDAAKSLPYGDPNYFAAAAMDISTHGWITDNTRWTFNLWPPGFMLLEGALLKLFGSNAPMPLLLLGLSAGLFAAVMMEMRRILNGAMGRWSWLAPLLIFSFPAARFFLLSITGLLFGEWLAIGCFFGAVLMLLRRSLKGAIFAGVLFAVSAYARSQYEFFLDVMLLVSVGLMAISFFWYKQNNRINRQLSKYFLLSLIVAQILMLPWRLYHLCENQSLRWVHTGPLIITASLSTDSTLIAGGAGWMVKGGINVACHIAPEHCGKEDAETYFRIFKDHPLEWISAKIELLPEYWFSSVKSLVGPQVATNFAETVFNGLFLICFIGSCALLWLSRKSDLSILWLGITLGLVIAHFFIVTFSHLEVRYFYFIKIYFVFFFLLSLDGFKSLTFQRKTYQATQVL